MGDVKPKSGSCDTALHSCLDYVTKADAHIKLLQENGKRLAKERDEALQMAQDEAGKESILPAYAWIGLGVLVGGVIGVRLSK